MSDVIEYSASSDVVGSARARRDEHTRELLEQAFATDDEDDRARLREQIVLENRSMAEGLAHHFAHRGVEDEDLVQVAMVGLINAVQRYRPGIGPAFSAFAVPTITGELKRYFRDHTWSVRPPRGLQELQRSVRDCAQELEQRLHRSPTGQEIAAELNVTVEQVDHARVVQRQYRAKSLDAPVGRDSDAMLGDSLSLDNADPYDDVLALVSLRGALRDLSPRDQLVVRMRFERNLTQRQIGWRLGVSQMQVSRLLHQIFGQLRQLIDEPDQAHARATARMGT